METDKILNIIIACFMALITFYLIILYLKSEAFKTYSCYNIIFMSIVILLDCILQIIPRKFGNDGEYEGWEYILNLALIFFDKLILSILSMQVIVLYLGIIHTELYFKSEKRIFIIGVIISLIVSGSLAAVYSSIRWVTNADGVYIYDEEEENDNKDETGESKERTLTRKVLDIIFSGILFVANVFCLIVVMSHISKKNKEAKAGIIEDLGYNRQLIRFLFIFFINIIAIVVSGIIINFKLLKKYDEIIYLIVCFVIDLCYSINKTVYVETMKLFCRNVEVNEEGKQVPLKKVSTFGDEDEGGDDNED